MSTTRYESILDCLLLLKKRNNAKSGVIDTSCIPVKTFNQLVSWGYVEIVDGNAGLRITKKGENILSFNKKNAEVVKVAITVD